MIGLTRTSGESCRLHPAAIQRVEAHPSTVVYLVDGAKYTVTESLEEIVRRIRESRAAVMATGGQLADSATQREPIGHPATLAARRAARGLGSLVPLRSRPKG